MSLFSRMTPERFLRFLLFFLLGVVIVFRSRFGGEEGLADYFVYYAGLLFGPLVTTIAGYVVVLLLVLFLLFGVTWIYGGVRGHNPHEKLSAHFGREARSWWKERIMIFLRAGVPTMIVYFLAGLVMSYKNIFNATRLRDDEILEWDKWIFGDYPFLALYEIQYPPELVWSIIYGFAYLPLAFFLMFFIVLYRKPELFSKMAVAFSLAIVVSLPLWSVFPVMSPHDRYIDNVYGLSIPDQFEERLANLEPQKEIQEYLDLARDRKTSRLREYYPTSTLPSAHVEWAVLFIYFSALVDRRWLWATVPIGVFSSIGTFFLAQHYVIDVPAGIIVAGVVIWVTNKLFPETQKPQ